MPEIPDLLIQDEIVIEWGNAIRDRTVQRYADATERDVEHPTPSDGDLAFLNDPPKVQFFKTANWFDFLPTGIGPLPFAGTAIPFGWLLCNGQAVSRSTYADLFAVIGTLHGAGDGSTTFNVPDMRGRYPFGKKDSGTGSGVGDTFGTFDHSHSVTAHTHTGPSHAHTMGTHTHSGPSHTHSINPPSTASSTAGNHAHFLDAGATAAAGAHSHSFSDSFTTGVNSGARSAGTSGATITVADNNHTHGGSVSGTTGSVGDHTHGFGTLDTDAQGNHSHATDIAAFTSSASGTGNTGATDPGDTNAGGTQNTGSAGGGNTGVANPPSLTTVFIIKT